MEEQKNNLIIIGNGFDLNLGMKTSYRDFLKYYTTQKESNDNFLIKYINHKKLNSESKSEENWYDIEYLLGEYSKDNPNDEIREEFIHLKNHLNEYLKNEDKRIIELNNFDYTFSEQFLRLFFSKLDFTQFISFNYTNILFRIIYNFLPTSSFPNLIHQIHGKLGIDGENIVFGVNDKVKVSRKHTFLLKARHTNSEELKHLNKLYSAKNIFFFGHSLGETDHSYFEDFFKNIISDRNGHKDINLTFFYFDKEALDNIKYELNKLTDHNLTKLKRIHNVKFIQTIPDELYKVREIIE